LLNSRQISGPAVPSKSRLYEGLPFFRRQWRHSAESFQYTSLKRPLYTLPDHLCRSFSQKNSYGGAIPEPSSKPTQSTQGVNNCRDPPHTRPTNINRFPFDYPFCLSATSPVISRPAGTLCLSAKGHLSPLFARYQRLHSSHFRYLNDPLPDRFRLTGTLRRYRVNNKFTP